ncbi:hypothetical protein [Parafrankia discariae]|uniref:hypothetical protein n=1 Tax=Parafrankia discariae TaxID=365528 RepID=UPI00037B2199|nr:hypothetical protein [Parafrankia discariae]
MNPNPHATEPAVPPAPHGTTARAIEELGDPGAGYYLSIGPLGTNTGPVRWWRVQGTQTTGDQAGASCTFPAADSAEDARVQLAVFRTDPENARYDTWEIVKMEAVVRHSLEPLKPETTSTASGIDYYAMGQQIGRELAAAHAGEDPDTEDPWADRDAEVDERRAVLAGNLDTAYGAIADGIRNLDALTGSLYDVEFVEGYGRDVASFLADARRFIGGATALVEKATR